MDVKVIKLNKPIALPGRAVVDSLTLRAPKYGDFVALGEPEIFVPLKGDTGGFFQPDMQVIERYIERLLPRDFDVNVLGSLCLADSLRLKDAVLGFFREAMVASGIWTTAGASSREASSSPTDSASETSAA